MYNSKLKTDDCSVYDGDGLYQNRKHKRTGLFTSVWRILGLCLSDINNAANNAGGLLSLGLETKEGSSSKLFIARRTSTVFLIASNRLISSLTKTDKASGATLVRSISPNMSHLFLASLDLISFTSPFVFQFAICQGKCNQILFLFEREGQRLALKLSLLFL